MKANITTSTKTSDGAHPADSLSSNNSSIGMKPPPFEDSYDPGDADSTDDEDEDFAAAKRKFVNLEGSVDVGFVSSGQIRLVVKLVPPPAVDENDVDDGVAGGGSERFDDNDEVIGLDGAPEHVKSYVTLELQCVQGTLGKYRA